MLVFPALAAGGCTGSPAQPEQALEADRVCPPDEPDCDRLDAPCVAEEEPGSASPMGPGSSPAGLTTSKTAAGKYRVWPTGRVPYKIDATVQATTKDRILKAMDEWQTKSGLRVRFEKATSTDGTFVVFTAGSPVTSHVGYAAGNNTKVSLRNPEYLTVVRHEIGHVLGFHHEQRRSDRLDHIQVKTANIVDSTHCKYQFSICSDCVLINDYHVTSIMHYRTSDLSSCRTGPVLLNKDDSAINHTWLITASDLAALAVLYPTPGTGTGGTGSGADAGADAASGGASTGGTAGAGGAAGSADDGGIDDPDETGGTAGAAGSSATGGGSAAGAATGGTSSGGSSAGSGGKGPSSSADSGDDGGCSVASPPRTGAASILAGLALIALGSLRRRRAQGRTTRAPR